MECGKRDREDRMKEPAKSFQDLHVWQKAHQLVLDVYQLSRGFPSSEIYGLTSQLRRAAVSIPANIAEGFRKRGKADKARFLNIAQGSLEEVRYYLILSKDLSYADVTKQLTLAEEVSKMLDAYCKAILTSVS
jgi:four helix bundle protein